jgi:hypothetical protein
MNPSARSSSVRDDIPPRKSGERDFSFIHEIS